MMELCSADASVTKNEQELSNSELEPRVGFQIKEESCNMEISPREGKEIADDGATYTVDETMQSGSSHKEENVPSIKINQKHRNCSNVADILPVDFEPRINEEQNNISRPGGSIECNEATGSSIKRLGGDNTVRDSLITMSNVPNRHSMEFAQNYLDNTNQEQEASRMHPRLTEQEQDNNNSSRAEGSVLASEARLPDVHRNEPNILDTGCNSVGGNESDHLTSVTESAVLPNERMNSNKETEQRQTIEDVSSKRKECITTNQNSGSHCVDDGVMETQEVMAGQDPVSRRHLMKETTNKQEAVRTHIELSTGHESTIVQFRDSSCRVIKEIPKSNNLDDFYCSSGVTIDDDEQEMDTLEEDSGPTPEEGAGQPSTRQVECEEMEEEQPIDAKHQEATTDKRHKGFAPKQEIVQTMVEATEQSISLVECEEMEEELGSSDDQLEGLHRGSQEAIIETEAGLRIVDGPKGSFIQMVPDTSASDDTFGDRDAEEGEINMIDCNYSEAVYDSDGWRGGRHNEEGAHESPSHGMRTEEAFYDDESSTFIRCPGCDELVVSGEMMQHAFTCKTKSKPDASQVLEPQTSIQDLAQEELECPECGVGFQKQEDLTIHLDIHRVLANNVKKMHENKKMLQLMTQVKAGSDQSDVISKVEALSSCNVCKESFTDPTMKPFHEMMHVNYPFHCKYCNLFFMKLSELQRQRCTNKRHHKAFKYKCGRCWGVMMSWHKMDKHQRKCPGKMETCGLCKQKFNTYEELAKHAEFCTDEEQVNEIGMDVDGSSVVESEKSIDHMTKMDIGEADRDINNHDNRCESDKGVTHTEPLSQEKETSDDVCLPAEKIDGSKSEVEQSVLPSEVHSHEGTERLKPADLRPVEQEPPQGSCRLCGKDLGSSKRFHARACKRPSEFCIKCLKLKDSRMVSKRPTKLEHNDQNSDSSQKGDLILKLTLPSSTNALTSASMSTDPSRSDTQPGVKKKKKKKKKKKYKEEGGACGKELSDFDSLINHTNESDSAKKQKSIATQSEAKQSSSDIFLDSSCPTPQQSQLPTYTDAPTSKDTSKSVEVPLKKKKKKRKLIESCGACGKEFSDFDSLLDHTNECESVKEGKSSATQSAIKPTVTSSNEINLNWSCPAPQRSQIPSMEAPTTTDLSKSVGEPEKKKKKKFKETCGACGKGFSDFDSLVSHASKCKSVKKQKLTGTQSEVKPTKQASNEINLDWSCPPPHRSQTSSCPKCNKKFSKAKKLEKHLLQCKQNSKNDTNQSLNDDDQSLSVLQKSHNVERGPDSGFGLVEESRNVASDIAPLNPAKSYQSHQEQANLSYSLGINGSVPEAALKPEHDLPHIDESIKSSVKACEKDKRQSISPAESVGSNEEKDLVGRNVDNQLSMDGSDVIDSSRSDLHGEVDVHPKIEDASGCGIKDLIAKRSMEGSVNLSTISANVDGACEKGDIPAPKFQSARDSIEDYSRAPTPMTLSTHSKGVDYGIQRRADLSSDAKEIIGDGKERSSSDENNDSQSRIDPKPSTQPNDHKLSSASGDGQTCKFSLPEEVQTSPESEETSSNQNAASDDQSPAHVTRDQTVPPTTERQDTLENCIGGYDLTASQEPGKILNLDKQDMHTGSSDLTCKSAILDRTLPENIPKDKSSRSSITTTFAGQVPQGYSLQTKEHESIIANLCIPNVDSQASNRDTLMQKAELGCNAAVPSQSHPCHKEDTDSNSTSMLPSRLDSKSCETEEEKMKAQSNINLDNLVVVPPSPSGENMEVEETNKSKSSQDENTAVEIKPDHAVIEKLLSEEHVSKLGSVQSKDGGMLLDVENLEGSHFIEEEEVVNSHCCVYCAGEFASKELLRDHAKKCRDTHLTVIANQVAGTNEFHLVEDASTLPFRLHNTYSFSEARKIHQDIGIDLNNVFPTSRYADLQSQSRSRARKSKLRKKKMHTVKYRYSEFGLRQRRDFYNFQCKVCGKMYKDKSVYKKHKHVKCELCDRSFTSKKSLRRHKLKHVTKSSSMLEVRVEKLGGSLILPKQHESIIESASGTLPVKFKEPVDVETDDCMSRNQAQRSPDMVKNLKAPEMSVNGIKQKSMRHVNYKSSLLSRPEIKEKIEEIPVSHNALTTKTAKVKPRLTADIQHVTPTVEAKKCDKGEAIKKVKSTGSKFNIPPPPLVEVQCNVCGTMFGHQSTLDRHMKMHRKR